MSITFFVSSCKTQVKDDGEVMSYASVVRDFDTLNVSNTNAADLLAMLGEQGYEGTWNEDRLVLIKAKLDQLLGSETLRRSLVRPTEVVTKNFVMCGTDINYITQRLTQLRELVDSALRGGYAISWW